MPVTDGGIAEVLADADILATACERLSLGFDKTTYRVDTAESSYVLQFYDRKPEAAECSLPFVAWIAARGYPTPRPRWIRTGGPRPAAVFPFVEGMHPDSATTALAEQMGSTLALLHRLAREYAGPLPVIDRLQVIRDAAIEAERRAALRPWADVAREWLRVHEEPWRRALEVLPAGPVHHDFHTDNVLVAGGNLASVLDFDEVQTAPFVIDIARALHYFAEEAEDLRLPRALVVAFLRGYESIRPASRDEHHALDLAFQLANLTHVAFSMLDPRDRPESLSASLRHRIYLANAQFGIEHNRES